MHTEEERIIYDQITTELRCNLQKDSTHCNQKTATDTLSERSQRLLKLLTFMLKHLLTRKEQAWLVEQITEHFKKDGTSDSDLILTILINNLKENASKPDGDSANRDTLIPETIS